MQLKSLIRFVVFVKSILGIGLFFLVFGFLSNVEHPGNLIYVLAFSFPFILCFFIRGIIIKNYCKNGKYPAALLSVLNSLDQTEYLRLSENQQIHSAYNKDTNYNEFPEYNSLRTTIGNNKQLKKGWLILLIAFVFSIFFFPVKISLKTPIEAGTMFLGFGLFVFLILSLQLLTWKKNKQQLEIVDPAIEFSPEKLRIENLELFWSSIISWKYKPMHEEADQLIVWYWDSNNKKCNSVIVLKYDIGYIDLCLLFHYFKTQYGSS